MIASEPIASNQREPHKDRESQRERERERERERASTVSRDDSWHKILAIECHDELHQQIRPLQSSSIERMRSE